MIVLRPPLEVSLNDLEPHVQKLLKHCTYRKKSGFENLPYFGDCLSTILFVTNQLQNMNIPIYWIGNAPSKLVEKWNFKILETDHLKPGDLIFMQRKNARKLITHVLMALSTNHLFHCTSRKDFKGCELVIKHSIYERYSQPFNLQELINYRDPRSKACVAQNRNLAA